MPGTNIMAGTNITRAGTNIMTRNEYYATPPFFFNSEVNMVTVAIIFKFYCLPGQVWDLSKLATKSL